MFSSNVVVFVVLIFNHIAEEGKPWGNSEPGSSVVLGKHAGQHDC
jgi:hypothetical protein